MCYESFKSNSDIGTFKICISLKFVVQAVRRKKRGKQKKNYHGDEDQSFWYQVYMTEY